MNAEILKKAIEKYGGENQIRQCMEECAELISAIVDYAENEEADIDNIIEEMVDVLITCKQVEIISRDYVLEPAGEVESEGLGKGTICNEAIKSLAELIKTLNKYLRGKELPKHEICYKISCVLLAFEFLADLLELDGVSDIEKQLNYKIKFKLNRLKERLENGRDN
jgi:NTP pyrophosphatase (non-canonical NTP hydrolase)